MLRPALANIYSPDDAEEPANPVPQPIPPPVQAPAVRDGSTQPDRSSVDRHSSRSSESEDSEVPRKVRSPIVRSSQLQREPSLLGRLSARSSGRFSTGGPTQALEDEIEAVQEKLKSVSYAALERGFHSGTHKQVGALQLSRLFDSLDLKVSPEALAEIEVRSDADGNGTISKQELLQWLEGSAAPGGDSQQCAAPHAPYPPPHAPYPPPHARVPPVPPRSC